jgi:hypothetical protein
VSGPRITYLLMPLMMHRPADIPAATGHRGIALRRVTGAGIRRVRARYISGPRQGQDQLPDPVAGGGARTLKGMTLPLPLPRQNGKNRSTGIRGIRQSSEESGARMRDLRGGRWAPACR